MALAMMVSTRLWLAGEVSGQRDMTLIRRLIERVRACALHRPLLWCTDGLCSSIRARRETFRDPVRTGAHGRPRLRPWRNDGSWLECARTVVLSRAAASLDAPQATWASLACAQTPHEAVVRGPRLAVELPAAAMLTIKVKTLQAWRVRGGGPRYVKVGRCVRYTPESLEAYIQQRTVAHTAQVVEA